MQATAAATTPSTIGLAAPQINPAAPLRQSREHRLLDSEAVGKFVVDCSAVLRLTGEEIAVSPKHELLAPTLLRSQTLSALHEAVQRGDTDAAVAREQLVRVGRMSIRLLGDAVLRRRAWEVADQLGWASTYDAEYIALTQLQADALVTLDKTLARAVRGIVEIASIDDLR